MSIPEDRSGYVGPYRVDRRLGRGGMGEVYAGFDERLGRAVALKRLWSSRVEGDATARKRFRREARVLARLRHPAIIQVFDWVESEDGDWIVMELVDGFSLRRLLRDGPLPPERAARLGRDVLVGLAVAHSEGIVHRDLKAENVMVANDSSPGRVEQAKILDFGVARWSDPNDSETRLSLDGRLIGTLSAMSPEQVRGAEVGPRSDLFSLGAMLYEMVTGTAPFRGDSTMQVIQRICSWDPPPASTVNPAVPEALSAFIVRLLQKDMRKRPPSAERALGELDAVLRRLPADDEISLDLPARGRGPAAGTPRPVTVAEPFAWTGGGRAQADELDGEVDARADASALEPEPAAVPDGEPLPVSAPAEPPRRRLSRRAVIAGAAGLALLIAALVTWLLRPARTLYVAVPPTGVAVAAGAATPDLELAASAVRTALLQGLLRFRDVVAVEPARGEPTGGDPVAIARGLAADEVLTSQLECSPSTCRLVLRRLRGRDGRLLSTAGLVVEPRSFLETELAIVEHVRAAYPEARLRPGVPDLQVRAADYETYLRLKDRYERREQGFSTEELLAGLERIERTSPRFLDARLLAATTLVRSFEATRERAHLERAAQEIERARAIAPEDPRVLLHQARVARAAGRFDEAETILERLRRLEPRNAERLRQKAVLLERKGQAAEAIALLREAIARHPSASAWSDLGSALYRHGDVAGARRAMEAGLLLAPAHYDGLSSLAQLELASGDPRRAAELYERLVSRSAETTELNNLATAYLLVGRYGEAARRLREALALTPSSPSALLNLADAELLAGRGDEARRLYAQVLDEIARDPEPEKLLSVRAQALAHLGRTQEAVADAQEALRLEPESPYKAYEASLVFVLVGDQATAVWNARRALGGGYDLRWFSFPWFDPIRPQLAAGAEAAPGVGRD